MSGHFQRVALTGGIATGKSSCLQRFAELGAPILDADLVARAVVEPGTPGLAAIVDRFGTGILLADGTLDRPALGRLVFADASARRELEAIVHPDVYQAIEQWFVELAITGASTRGIADIPLLYETGQADRFDVVIVAACPASLQLERLMARDGLARDDALQRIGAQISIDVKRDRADIVIDTSGSLAETRRRVDRVWRQMTASDP